MSHTRTNQLTLDDDTDMWKWTSLLLTVAACGFPRPADVNACTPGEFSACRGDTALTCNSAGDDYDAVRCERGCDPAAGGCRLCQASQTVCVNGKVQSCDATGAVTSSEACPLGCFEDQPRCREIDPSNGLAKYLDMVPNPPDLDLSNATFNTRSGDVKDGTTTMIVPSFETQSSGILLRVFVANSIHLAIASIQGDPGATGPSFALVARDDITVGKITVTPGAGGIALSGCSGGFGGVVEAQEQGGGSSATFSSGGGGGGHATGGGDGGAIIGLMLPGSGGAPSGTSSLEPLRGGCPGGFVNDVNSIPSDPYGGAGGGAIQLSSRTRIEIEDIINVRGRDGDYENLQQSDNTGAIITSGGGAGGGILLEAPQVVLGSSAQLLAAGGHGGSACGTPTPSCAVGGAGATATAPAAAGGSLAGNASSGYVTAGGGGGGPGRIRINTPDGTYTKSNTSIEEGSLSTGILKTR